MSDVYSNRLEKRNFEINLPSVETSDNNYKFQKGEITGDQLLYDNIGLGMPIRSNFTPSRNEKHIENRQFANDVNLFSEQSDFNISYNDSQSNFANYNDSQSNFANYNDSQSNFANFSNFDNNNNNKIQKNKSNDILISNNINEYSTYLLNIIERYYKSSFLVSSYNLINTLGTFYISSKTNQLGDYLGMKDKLKPIYSNNLETIKNILNNISYYNIFNFIILPYNYQINKTFVANNDALHFVQYDRNQDLNSESQKINMYISNKCNYNFDTLKSHHLNNILCLFSGFINLQWSNNFDNVFKDIFYSYKKRNQIYLLSKNKYYYHSETDNLELIELPTYDNKLAFGCVLSKEEFYPKIESLDLEILISSLKLTQFGTLVLPQIKETFKLKYTNILKETGVNIDNLDIQNIIPDKNIKINEILQNITLIVDKNETRREFKPKTQVNKINQKTINTPFYYYVRLIEPSVILNIGIYS